MLQATSLRRTRLSANLSPGLFLTPVLLSLLALLVAMSLAAFLAGPAQAQAPIFAADFEHADLCPWRTPMSGATCCGGAQLVSSFDGPGGSSWPAPWTLPVGGGNVALADLQGDRARLRPMPTGYSLARVIAPFGARDAEAVFTVRMENVATQGVGFYLRQNGGYLTDTAPDGFGYAVFVEGPFIGSPGLGVWKEVDGHEIPLRREPDVPALDDDTDYRVRFRVVQLDAVTTLLAAKMWLLGAPEPADWDILITDDTPELQNLSGGLAIDSWSSITDPSPITAHTFVDDLEVTSLCSPLEGLGAIELAAGGLQFAEGPVWRGDHVLFTDIDADTIYRLDPPSGLSTFRTPSDQANGLALDIDGTLLAAEHATRRLSRTQAGGTVVSLVETWMGDRFNSPNDLAVRSDGTVYFTDPDYGLADLNDRELAFNGLFRLTSVGVVEVEWQGTPPVNQPNGIALSPDETVLYLVDTEQGEIRAFDVAADGSLSGERLFAGSLSVPDGLCVDRGGNVWVATWGEGLVALAPDGSRWGAVALPNAATNCTFGETFDRDLYVTTLDTLYRLRAVWPGVR